MFYLSSTLKFPGGSAGKESACNAGDLGSIPGLGRSPGEGVGYPLQYSGLENSIDCIVHGVTKSWTQLSDFHFEITKKKCHTFLHLINEEDPPPHIHHKNKQTNSNELLGRAMAALSGIPSLVHATRFWVHHPHVLKNI